MSKIKSALELALEKTAGVSVDRDAVRREERTKEGRVLAGRYLSETPPPDLKKALSEFGKEDRALVRDGLVTSLLANVTLPRYESDLGRLPKLQEALASVTGDPKAVDAVMGQVTALLGQFMDNLRMLDDQLRERWEPRLRQKEQQLRQQTGRDVRLIADQDPEFVKVLGDEIRNMEAQYGEVLERGKAEIKKLA